MESSAQRDLLEAQFEGTGPSLAVCYQNHLGARETVGSLSSIIGTYMEHGENQVQCNVL